VETWSVRRDSTKRWQVPSVYGVGIHVSPWRFDMARDAALSLLPADIDVCVAPDLDEVLQPGWRAEIEKVWEKGKTTRLRYFFDWGHGIKFRYEKIHARHGYRWHHPVHEYPVPYGITEVWAETDALLVSHHPDPEKSRGQYMPLLELAVKEDPAEPRNAFYYARELTFHRRWEDAWRALDKYLLMTAVGGWINERCYAMRLMAKVYEAYANPAEQERWLLRACGEAPNTREPWCELAMLYYRQSRWSECLGVAERALEIKDREMVYTCDPAVWGWWAPDLACIAAYRLGLKEKAVFYGEVALACEPENKRLQDNLAFARSLVSDKFHVGPSEGDNASLQPLQGQPETARGYLLPGVPQSIHAPVAADPPEGARDQG